MNNLPAIQEQDLSTFKRLSLEKIQELFFNQQEYCGFLIRELDMRFDRDGGWLETLELYQVATQKFYKLNGPRRWTRPEPEGPIVEGSAEREA